MLSFFESIVNASLVENLRCVPSTTYFATPEFLKRAVTLMIIVSTPVHILGFYMILYKTPRQMSSVKWYFVNLHVFIVIFDHILGTLSIPFLLLPTPSGYSLGLLPKLGVPDLLIVILVFIVSGYVLIAILAIFENRFNIMCQFSWKPRWEEFRPVWLASHYIFMIIIFIPFYFLMPEQESAKQAIFEKLPCLPDYIRNAPLFVLSHSPRYHLISLFGFMLFGTFECSIFICALVWNVFQQVRTKKISQRTFQLQVNFMIAVFIQMMVPVLTMLGPATYMWFAVLFKYYNQAYMNMIILLETLHGVFSTFAMIFLHFPYRNVFMRMICVPSDNSIGDARIGKKNDSNVVSITQN